MPSLHADALALSREVGANIQLAADNGFLSDAVILPLTTTAGLIAAVNSAVVSADREPMRARIVSALNKGIASGEITDAAVTAADTVAGLRALTQIGSDQARHLIDE